MTEPSYSRIVKSVEEFHMLAKDVAHFAVKRSRGAIEYFHHYLVNGCISAKEKIIEYYVNFSNLVNPFSSGPGEVIEKQISEADIENSIADGILYVIEAPGYPETESEKREAKYRLLKRLGEKAYALASSNCEHLVSYILTGHPYSEQIRNAGPWKMLAVDTFDSLTGHVKRTFGSLLAMNRVSSIVTEATFNLVKAASTVPLRSLRPVLPTSRAASNLCKWAFGNTQYDPTTILRSRKCVDIANAASKNALKETAITTFKVTGILEAANATYDIWKLYKGKQKGFLTERDYYREVTKTCFGATAATASTVLGGVLGQALCPIPVLGYSVGSCLGNVAGRWFGSVFGGCLFDGLW